MPSIISHFTRLASCFKYRFKTGLLPCAIQKLFTANGKWFVFQVIQRCDRTCNVRGTSIDDSDHSDQNNLLDKDFNPTLCLTTSLLLDVHQGGECPVLLETHLPAIYTTSMSQSVYTIISVNTTINYPIGASEHKLEPALVRVLIIYLLFNPNACNIY